jgi:hypothetical protein
MGSSTVLQVIHIFSIHAVRSNMWAVDRLRYCKKEPFLRLGRWRSPRLAEDSSGCHLYNAAKEGRIFPSSGAFMQFFCLMSKLAFMAFHFKIVVFEEIYISV